MLKEIEVPLYKFIFQILISLPKQMYFCFFVLFVSVLVTFINLAPESQIKEDIESFNIDPKKKLEFKDNLFKIYSKYATLTTIYKEGRDFNIDLQILKYYLYLKKLDSLNEIEVEGVPLRVINNLYYYIDLDTGKKTLLQ